MSRLHTFVPPIVENRREEAERERAEKVADTRPGFLRAAADAANSEWATSWFYRSLTASPDGYDPEFNPFDDQNIRPLTEGLDPDLWDGYDGAQSLSHAIRIRDGLMSVQESRRRLASLGWKGTALQIGASILDPAAITAGVLSGGAGAEAVYAAKASRLARFARAGLINAAADTSTEAYLSAVDPQRGYDDVVYSALGSFILGGTLDAGLHAIAQRTMREIEYDGVRSAMGAQSARGFYASPELSEQFRNLTVTENGKVRWREQTDPATRKDLQSELINHFGLDETDDADELAELTALSPDDFIARITADRNGTPFGLAADEPPPLPEGSAQQTQAGGGSAQKTQASGDAPAPPPPPPPKKAGDFSMDGLTDARATWTPTRMSVAGRIGASNSPEMRAAGTAYAEDALPKRDGTPSVESGEEWRRRASRAAVVPFYEKAAAHLGKWFDSEKTPWPARGRGGKAEREFFEKAGIAARSPRGMFTDPDLNAVTDAARDVFRKTIEAAHRHGVLKDIDSYDTYVPRLWNLPKIVKAESVLGDAEHSGTEILGDIIGRAIKARSDDMDDASASRLGRIFLRVIKDTDRYSEIQKAHLLDPDKPELLAGILRDHGVSEADIDSILSAAMPKTVESGVHPRGRRRMNMDEGYSETAPTLDGGVIDISIADLLENDIRRLVDIYSTQMHGLMAEQTILDAFSARAGRKIETFDGLLKHIESDMRDRGIKPDEGKGRRDLDRLKLVRRHMLGMRITDTGIIGEVANPETAHFLRRLRAFNHWIASGSFGIAQLPEFANVVIEGGARAMVQQMPALSSLLKRAKDGTLDNDLLRELNAFISPGTDRLVAQVLARMDDEVESGVIGGAKVDRILQRGQLLANDLSGVAPITIVQQRMAAILGAQNLVNAAFGKTPSAKRLAVMGLDAAKWERLSAAIRKEASVSGRSTLKTVNLDSWEDQGAAAMFVTALSRWSKRVIQENSVGTAAAWMSTDMGKVITQFRNFGFSAYEKNFLHRLAVRDFRAFAAVMGTSLTAALAYVAQTYLNSTTRADAQQFRDKNLSLDRILKQGFSRGGFASIVPGVADSLNMATGGDQVFGFGRQSGLSGDYLLGNPTTALFTSAARATSAIGGAVRGKGFDRQDAEALARIVPFRNVIGIKNVIDAITSRVPDR